MEARRARRAVHRRRRVGLVALVALLAVGGAGLVRIITDCTLRTVNGSSYVGEETQVALFAVRITGCVLIPAQVALVARPLALVVLPVAFGAPRAVHRAYMVPEKLKSKVCRQDPDGGLPGMFTRLNSEGWFCYSRAPMLK